jgi:hypothetical protein
VVAVNLHCKGYDMDKAQGIEIGRAAASADVAQVKALLSALIADGDVKRRGTWAYFANKTLAYLCRLFRIATSDMSRRRTLS